MHEVVCATRGGQGSRAVRQLALERAGKTGRSVLFFFALDTTIVQESEETLHVAVRDELEWQGRVLLEIARRQAEEAGVGAKIVIREGRFRDELIDLLKETEASVCLLGAPRGTTATIFGDDAIERLAAEVQRATGVPVEIARPEDLAGEE